MGCVNSRTDTNDLHSNEFHVMNVDDSGNLVIPGRLELTETEIVLYQRGKEPIQWPLRCLRRYGYDAEIFSFESGRRCPTGPGIYAFKCHKAAHIFHLVQSNIQVCNNSGDDAMSREFPIASHSGPTATRVTIPVEPNYLDPIPSRASNCMVQRLGHTQQNGIGRLGSMGSSTGLISPQGTIGSPSPPPGLPPPPPPFPQPHPSSLYVNEEVLSPLPLEMEHNNNKSPRRAIQRSCTMSNSVSDNGSVSLEFMPTYKNLNTTTQNKSPLSTTAAYMNVDITNDISSLSPTHSVPETIQFKEDKNENNESGHAYMNISPGEECTELFVTRGRPSPLLSIQPDVEETTRHCYANLEANEIESLRKRFSGVSVAEKSPLTPSTPTGGPIREVNYAVLDLDTKDVPINSSLEGPSNSSASPPESPNKLQKGYTTIDFNKTVALSHSVNPNLVNDNEGSRKTRHNSTISDLTAPCRRSSSSKYGKYSRF